MLLGRSRTVRADVDPGAAIESDKRYLKSFQSIDPTLRCLPDFVHGTPVALDTLRFAVEIPSNRLQLKPPLFIASPFL